ncbi:MULTISPECIES: hypothetical protein [unclassified Streptomyces]|uniref:hypothetical protein n=1 Tax=unclassified Streptomyces TaxID=2593676 RepID=UPI003794CCEB
MAEQSDACMCKRDLVLAAGVFDLVRPDGSTRLGDVFDAVAAGVVGIVAKRQCAVGDEGDT